MQQQPRASRSCRSGRGRDADLGGPDLRLAAARGFGPCAGSAWPAARASCSRPCSTKAPVAVILAGHGRRGRDLDGLERPLRDGRRGACGPRRGAAPRSGSSRRHAVGDGPDRPGRVRLRGRVLLLGERVRARRARAVSAGGCSAGCPRARPSRGSRRTTEATALSAIRSPRSSARAVVTRWSASPGDEERARCRQRRALHRTPELHRQPEREHRDDDRRPERRRERPQAVGQKRHGQRERDEIRRRSAARSARTGLPRPTSCPSSPSRLRRSRRARRRAGRASGRDQPRDEADRQRDPSDERRTAGRKHEGDRRQQHREQHDPLDLAQRLRRAAAEAKRTPRGGRSRAGAGPGARSVEPGASRPRGASRRGPRTRRTAR